MELVPSFTLYLSYAILMSILIYAIGHLILSFWKREYSNDFELFFKKMAVGVIMATVTYACYKAHFNTILSGVWIISGLYLIWNKNLITKFSIKHFKEIEWKPIAFYLSGLLFLMVFFYFRAITINGTPRLVFLDNPFYSGIADFLNRYGIESTTFNTFDITGQTPSFYHFFNEWYMALIAKIFNITSLSAYSFIGLPIIWSIVFVGAVWISYQFFNKHYIVHWLIALSFFFILGLGEYLQKLFFIDKGITFWDMNLLDVRLTKLAIACILIITAAMSLNREKLTIHFFYPLALLSILYITFFPTIFGGTVIYYLYQTQYKKTTPHKELIMVFLSTVYIISFYFINSLFFNKSVYESYGMIDHFSEYLKSNELSIKTYIITFYVTFFRLFVASLLYFTFFIINKKRLKAVLNFNKSLWIFISGVILTGYFSYVMLAYTVDGYQILSNVAQSFYIILLFSFLCYIVSTANKYDWIVLTLIIAFLIVIQYRHYPQEESWNLAKINIKHWQQLEKEFKGKEFSSAYIRKENCGRSYNHNLDLPYLNLRYVTTSYYPAPLSVFEMPPYPNLGAKATDIRTKSTSAFYKFVMRNKLINNIDSAKILFIEQYKIDYLFVERGNQWFEKTKSQLPISNTIEDDTEPYLIIKLNW